MQSSTYQTATVEKLVENLTRRKLPKLLACIPNRQVEAIWNKHVRNTKFLDKNGLKRRKNPLWKCLVEELRESGFENSADFLQDLIHDNEELKAQDDLGVLIDLRQNNDYLEMISQSLQEADTQKEKGNTKQESHIFLKLALYFSGQGKGVLWLAEKFFLVSIAVAKKFLCDGGRFKELCKFCYAKFIIVKFPGSDIDEAYDILINVRDKCMGKNWTLFEKGEEDLQLPENERNSTLFYMVSISLYELLIQKTMCLSEKAPEKAETYARLAEQRAKDVSRLDLQADAFIEIGKSQMAYHNLRSAVKSLTTAFEIYDSVNNINGICEAKMQLSAAFQRLGDSNAAVILLTEMGAIAMKYKLRYQLARALHLLGELHLRNNKPDLATQHLFEAFVCFMGLESTELHNSWTLDTNSYINIKNAKLSALSEEQPSAYIREADQARFLMAVSAGQEKISSLFELLKKSDNCNVAKIKLINWKLHKMPWWIDSTSDNFEPCECPEHQRTLLDVMKNKMQDQRLKHIKENEDKIN